MNYVAQEWLNLVLRWVHVFAGIMWVGATYYFTWLDRRFHTTDPEQVWMVHSGGFYVVRKEKQHDPAHTLHWFKWEAAMTWISGLSTRRPSSRTSVAVSFISQKLPRS